MLRFAVVSITIALALGPDAAVLCTVWCHPDEAATGSCQHHDETRLSRVSHDDRCAQAVPGAPTFIREEARRSTPDPTHALAVVGDPLAEWTAKTRSLENRGDPPALPHRPLQIPLRL